MTFSDKLRGRWPELWQLALVTETLATHLDVSIGTVGVRIGSSSNLAKRLESGRVQYSTPPAFWAGCRTCGPKSCSGLKTFPAPCRRAIRPHPTP